MILLLSQHRPRHLRGPDRDDGRVPAPIDGRCSCAPSSATSRSTSPTWRCCRPRWSRSRSRSGYHFVHPAGELVQLPVIAALMLVWFASSSCCGSSPGYHWHPIRHIALSALRRGSALKFDPTRGAGSLEPADRRALRAAVVDRLPPASLVPSTVDGDGAGNGGEAGDGAKATGAGSPAATPTPPPKGRGWSGLLRQRRRAGRGPDRRSRASSTPASRCTCSPTSRSRCA